MAKRKVSNPYGRGSIATTKVGTYRVRVYLGRDSSDKQIFKSKTFKTVQECNEWADSLIRKMRLDVDIDAGRQTIREYAEAWIPVHVKKQGLRATTEGSIHTGLKFALEMLGNLKLEDLRIRHLDELVTSDLASEDKRHRAYRYLKQVITAAFREGAIERNPFDQHERPRRQRQAEPAYWEKEELAILLNETQGKPLHTIIQTLISTGIRVGELIGLTWGDIDFEKRTMRVRRTIRQVGGATYIHPAKTANSVRTITMSEKLNSVLKEHRASQREFFMANGIRSEEDLVFASDAGTYRKVNNLHNMLRKAVAAAGLPQRKGKFHSFRHTSVALALSNGSDLMAISRRLGHADAGFTLRRYGHLLNDGQDQVSRSADDFLDVQEA